MARRGVGRKSNEPAVQEIVVQLLHELAFRPDAVASTRGHRQSSAAYGRLTEGMTPQRKCHHRINRSIAIANQLDRRKASGSRLCVHAFRSLSMPLSIASSRECFEHAEKAVRAAKLSSLVRPAGFGPSVSTKNRSG
jgi:hypothetical protein